MTFRLAGDPDPRFKSEWTGGPVRWRRRAPPGARPQQWARLQRLIRLLAHATNLHQIARRIVTEVHRSPTPTPIRARATEGPGAVSSLVG
jgi:hypothetical protein